MEDNIEVKDVQKTEYLDKNGLDMLWTKIKENTHNQVEVERNRAVAKENSITNSFSDFVSKTTTDDQTINSNLLINKGVLGIIESQEDESSAGLSLDSTAKRLKITSGGITCNGGSVSSGDGLFFEANGRLSDIYHTSGQMIVRQFDRLNTEVSDQGVFVGNNTADGQRGIQITGNGIQIEETTQVPVNKSSDKVFATDGSIANLTEYIKIASNITTGGFGVVRTVDTINNNIGVGDNRSQLAYIGKGELGVISYNNDGYATESFRYTTSYGFEMTNNRGYKSVKIPCDSNKVSIYKGNSNNYCTDYRYSGVVLGENNDDSNLLNTNGSYKTIGTDIAPLENGKVPAEYLDLTQYALSSTLAALEQKVTDNTTAISAKQDAGNYIPYNMLAFKNKYVIEPSYSIEFRTDALNNKYGKAFIGPHIISITSASGQHAAVEPEKISIRQSGNASGRIHSTLNVDSFGVYNNNDDSVIFKLNQYGIKLEDGDDNHVLTSNASTIDIREYALKSVYDKKIAALEARIAALEAKHAETA